MLGDRDYGGAVVLREVLFAIRMKRGAVIGLCFRCFGHGYRNLYFQALGQNLSVF